LTRLHSRQVANPHGRQAWSEPLPVRIIATDRRMLCDTGTWQSLWYDAAASAVHVMLMANLLPRFEIATMLLRRAVQLPTPRGLRCKACGTTSTAAGALARVGERSTPYFHASLGLGHVGPRGPPADALCPHAHRQRSTTKAAQPRAANTTTGP
jgi:hypothetical protein